MKLSVVVLLGLVLLSGCRRATVLQVQAGGKVFLNPRQGDKLQWVDSHGLPLPVTFRFGSPCEQPGDTVTACTINVPSGYYKYTCDGCIDPGIGVGTTSSAVLVFKPTGNGANTADTPDPFIYCDHGAAAAEKVVASVGDKIQWFGAGPIKDWTVTLAEGTCVNNGPLNQANPLCTIKAGAVSHPYQVQASICGGNGSSSITIR